MNNNEEKNKRLEDFREAYQKIIKQYNVDLASYPVFVPQKDGTFTVSVNIQAVDTTEFGEKSPIQDIIKK